MIISSFFSQKRKQIALLIDPDKHTLETLTSTIQLAEVAGVDYYFVGGSITQKPIEPVVRRIKELSICPVILFPGNGSQLCVEADGLLCLSLISGRNPEFLIGQHVLAAPFIAQSGLVVIPTGYILIDGGHCSSVEYISNTRSIPRNKTDIIVATALAGKCLGLQSFYLEAGSGALVPVPTEAIVAVKKQIEMPLIIGGGIRSPQAAEIAFGAGADVVVVGTAVEQSPKILQEICSVKQD